MSDDFMNLVIAGIILVIFILIAVLAYMSFKEKMQKKSDNNSKPVKNNEIDDKSAQKSIFKFMEFDNIEDNMIVQDSGKRYLMVIECKGVNYDLLSNVEKTSIEQGFLEFLNALKFEVQIYVQTRKVNLAQSTMKYRERLKLIENDMRMEEAKYEDMQRMGGYTKDEILKEIKEVTKKRNLYEYGRDVIENTEQMSEDSDLTTKEYYIVVPYYTEEITSAGDYDKREISSMAFSELYTRAQALVSALSECEVRGHIMNSRELIELLFVAYNREQHDVYDFEEYMSKSGYQTFYSVAEDVLEKRMKAIDEEIAQKASQKAFDAYKLASKRTRDLKRRIEEREQRMQEFIDSRASQILDQESEIIGKNLATLAKEQIQNVEQESHDERSSNKIKQNNNSNKTQPETQKVKRELTEEERRRRIAIIKKRKLLKEREAQINGKKENRA